MMMIVDTSLLSKPFSDMVNELEKVGEEMGVQVKCQREEIFERMHRI
jgi:ACT domain-containing protein